MTDRKYRWPSLADRVEQYGKDAIDRAAEYSKDPNATRKVESDRQQVEIARLRELRPIQAERVKVFRAGALAWLEKTIEAGKSGVLAGRQVSGKQNADMFARKPDLFDYRSGDPFGGACSVADAMQWLEDQELDPLRASISDIYFATYRNISRLKDTEQAIELYKALLEEFKTLFTEE